MMNQDRESVAVEGDIEDRISVLPRNVIDCILELLPVKEAAKTCTLSKSWRYVWSELPKMVLDYEFCDELIEESESNSEGSRWLEIASCSFKPPSSFLGFPNLVTLRLASITFSESCVIKAPLLANLILNCCDGMQYLNIVSPVLKSLNVCYRHSYIALNCFMNCKNLRDLGLVFAEVVDNPNHNRRSTLENLLVSLPALEILLLDSLFIEFLIAEVVPSNVYLILVKGTNDNVEAFLKCLKTPGCLQLPSTSSAPSLLRIFIEQPIGFDFRNAGHKLSRLPRASPKAELVCDLRVGS
ncbi:hypothetical protein HAX54_010205 [Datura stramonium]|uniref:F-box domain-containing protein n=1 Tax=Datura stramonium TaxID=4076 RepID=A0ABS8TGT7_DATST|nr:hypothetical protein [Datura stramonium]